LPHASAARFARRLCRADGHVLPDTMILRPPAEAAPVAADAAEQVLTVPQTTPLPNDQTLRARLAAIDTPVARALDAAFARVGNPARFEDTLLTALKAVKRELRTPDRRFTTHLTRLGAEAFVLGIQLEDDNTYDFFPDRPERAGRLGNAQVFFDYAVRRLLELSTSTAMDVHRRQMSRALVLFEIVQADLAREFALIVSPQSVALAYRTLLMQILWMSHQALQDDWLATASRSRLASSVLDRDWEASLRLGARTQADDDQAVAPMFRLTPTHYRDYFNPTTATDIGFAFYTPPPHPPIGDGPEISFVRVFRRRLSQKALIKDLAAESGADPLPRLHDSGSWQRWIRALWDKPLLRRREKIVDVLEYVSRYFEEFTAAVPHDLLEGCGEANYLTRTFPRAITGAIVHDCLVYATRWLHMLGGLFTAGATPAGIANPRLFLIDMPAHVGVMIRADIAFLGPTTRHVVIAINNKTAEMHTDFVATDKDVKAAEVVVHGMYRDMKTPFVVRPLASRASDARLLWNEICGLSGSKLTLPFASAGNLSQVRYLDYNAKVAAISHDTLVILTRAWLDLGRNLDAEKAKAAAGSANRQRQAIRRYAAGVVKAVNDASDRYKRDVEHLIADIAKDLDDNKQRLGATPISTPVKALQPWEDTLVKYYRPALIKAETTLDISAIQPEHFFAIEDFAAAVE
jgi:hypothetical protein